MELNGHAILIIIDMILGLIELFGKWHKKELDVYTFLIIIGLILKFIELFGKR